jgi:hypothetical protein
VVFFGSFDRGGVERGWAASRRGNCDGDVVLEDFVWVCELGLWVAESADVSRILELALSSQGTIQSVCQCHPSYHGW